MQAEILANRRHRHPQRGVDEGVVTFALGEPLIEGVEDLLGRIDVGDLAVYDVEDGVADRVAPRAGIVVGQGRIVVVIGIVVVVVCGGGAVAARRGSIHPGRAQGAQLLFDRSLEREGEAHGARKAGEGIGRIAARCGPRGGGGRGFGARRGLGIFRRLQRAADHLARQRHAELRQFPQHRQPLLGARDAGINGVGGDDALGASAVGRGRVDGGFRHGGKIAYCNVGVKGEAVCPLALKAPIRSAGG